jgi:hypothetical protein
MRAGVNFTNVLRTAFMLVDPESVKIIDNLTVFSRFWDLRAKKLHLKVYEIEPRCQFHQHSTSSFACADPKSTKKTDDLTVFFVLSGSACVKSAFKMLMKLTPSDQSINVI